MGGAGLGQGNITPVAEFNIYVDAEAMHVVLNACIPLFIVGWDISLGTAFIDAQDIAYLLGTGSEIARFCVRCNRSLQEFNQRRFNLEGFDLPDPATVVAALYPETVTATFDAYTTVETRSELTYGQLLIDAGNTLSKQPNARICQAMDGKLFKQRLFKAIV
jgi:purine nucleosidase